jgi:adenine deaminase
MSPDDGENVASVYRELLLGAKNLGCAFRLPYITMSFMALPVIQSLKLTDKGLVDVSRFDFIPLVADLFNIENDLNL